MQNKIIKSGSVSRPIQVSGIVNKLPVGVYKFGFDQDDNPILSDYTDFTLPTKLYGNDKVEEFTKRVLNTFSSVTNNVGVLLTGIKGTGKSIQLKHIAVNSDMPCIIVDNPYGGSILMDFIDKLPNSCVVIFDEFEKVYRETPDQESILPLLDGLSTGHHMFLFTVNGHVNEFLINRPSRIRYVKRYVSLTVDTIKEIVYDRLNNKDKQDDVIGFLTLFKEMNIDTVVSFINECNLYPEDEVSDIADIFNISNPLEEIMNLSAKIYVPVVPEKFKNDHEYMDEILEAGHQIWNKYCSSFDESFLRYNVCNTIIYGDQLELYSKFVDEFTERFKNKVSKKLLKVDESSSINNFIHKIKSTHAEFNFNKVYTTTEDAVKYDDNVLGMYGYVYMDSVKTEEGEVVKYVRKPDNTYDISVDGVVVVNASKSMFY